MDKPVIRWKCTTCGTVTNGSGLSDSVVPGMRLGTCRGCGKNRRTFRITDEPATTVDDRPKKPRQPKDKGPGLGLEMETHSFVESPYGPNRCRDCERPLEWHPRPGPDALYAKEVGMRGAEFSEVSSGWVQRADDAIRHLAGLGKPFTSDHVVALVGMPGHYNALGARMNAAARKGVIRKAGYTNAARPSAHARSVALWQGA